MKPLFLAASGLDDVHPITCLTRSKALMDIMRRRQPDGDDRASVFPVSFAGIFSESEEDGLHNFVHCLLNTNDPARTPWAIENKQVWRGSLYALLISDVLHRRILSRLLCFRAILPPPTESS